MYVRGVTLDTGARLSFHKWQTEAWHRAAEQAFSGCDWINPGNDTSDSVSFAIFSDSFALPKGLNL